VLNTLKTTDLDELSAAEEDWEIHHRPLQPERFEGQLLVGCIGGIQVDLEQWNTALELTGISTKQGLSYVLPLHEGGSYTSEGQEVSADQIDVYGPGREIYALTKQQASLLACSIPIAALDDRIDSPLATLLAGHATRHTVIRSTPCATEDLRRWCIRLLDLSVQDSMPTDAHDRLLDETLLIIARTLNQGNEARWTRSRHRYLLARQARDYMLERQPEAPTITELCTVLKTSERTLHYAFSEMYGVSPKRFLKAQRLLAVHRALKSAADGERVCDIAMRLGFWDLGYFARDYKAMFGELPSATLRKT
jgi:AraC family ethanolamine operon transcriptional activator